MRVLRSRSDGTARCIRYRKCPGCDHKVTTRETAVGGPISPESSRSGTSLEFALIDLIKREGLGGMLSSPPQQTVRQSNAGDSQK